MPNTASSLPATAPSCCAPETAPARWSSRFAFNLAAVGAAVGLGSTFLLVFILACVVIATPLLAAEFIIGSSRDDLLKNLDLIRAIGL